MMSNDKQTEPTLREMCEDVAAWRWPNFKQQCVRCEHVLSSESTDALAYIVEIESEIERRGLSNEYGKSLLRQTDLFAKRPADYRAMNQFAFIIATIPAKVRLKAAWLVTRKEKDDDQT